MLLRVARVNETSSGLVEDSNLASVPISPMTGGGWLHPIIGQILYEEEAQDKRLICTLVADGS